MPNPLLIFVVMLLLLPALVMAANDRPLLFGQNPTPMSWWNLDPERWEPILYRKMRSSGATVVRQGVGWDHVEKVRGQYDWSGADEVINRAIDHNLEVVLLFGGTPEWALPDDLDPKVTHPNARYPAKEEYAEDFTRFVTALVNHFKGRVRYYEFWNEANGFGWYSSMTDPPRYNLAEEYTPWMIRAYKALKAADPTAMMSTTGIDDNGPGHAKNYLTKIYENGGKGFFDAVADHPYSAAELDVFKLDEIREVLDANGDHHVKVWITEFGYPMKTQDYEAYQRYMKFYFDTITSEKYSYVTISTWHTANEFPWEEGYGLRNWNLTPRPPLQTFIDYPKPARPRVSDVRVVKVDTSSAVVDFSTDIPSRSLVMYGPSRNYGQVTKRTLENSTHHTATLTGLEPGTAYHFRVRTGAVEDGDAFSVDFRLQTPIK